MPHTSRHHNRQYRHPRLYLYNSNHLLTTFTTVRHLNIHFVTAVYLYQNENGDSVTDVHAIDHLDMLGETKSYPLLCHHHYHLSSPKALLILYRPNRLLKIILVFLSLHHGLQNQHHYIMLLIHQLPCQMFPILLPSTIHVVNLLRPRTKER